MLYELIAVVRPGNLNEIKEIARSAGMTVLNGGGVVRGYSNWGPFALPRRVRSNQATFSRGHYFVMRFDSSAPTQNLVRRTLGLDPRMIRFSVVKLGGTLDAIKDVSGTVPWRKREEGLLG